MGLLGNVAEVEYLRIHLMQERYVTVFANLLRSNSDGIEVSYFLFLFSFFLFIYCKLSIQFYSSIFAIKISNTLTKRYISQFI